MARSAGSSAGGPIRRVLLLMNPAARQAAALRHAQRRIEEHPGVHIELIVPDAGDQARQTEQARAAVEEGVDVVVVCGGDGMVSAGVGLVALRGIPLGIIPAGSGNDFARTAGIVRRCEPALQRVLDALSQPQLPVRAVDALRMHADAHHDGGAGDAGRVRRRWAANSVNIGFDARVNQRANAGRGTPRQLRYLVALAREVPRFSPERFYAQFDDAAPARLDSALVCIQNGATIGGGIPLAPGARIDDSWAEVSHVGPLSRAGLVALFPLLMLGMHRWLRPLTTVRARRCRIWIPAAVPVFADGDEVLPGASTGDEVLPGASTGAEGTAGADGDEGGDSADGADSASGRWVSVELVPGAVELLG